MVKKVLKNLDRAFRMVLALGMTFMQVVSPLSVLATEEKGDIRNNPVTVGSLADEGDVQVTKTVYKIDDDGNYRIDFNVMGIDVKETEEVTRPIYAVVVFDKSGSMLCSSGDTTEVNHDAQATINNQKLRCSQGATANVTKWNNAVSGAISFSQSLLAINNTYLSLVTFSTSAEDATAFSRTALTSGNFGYPHGYTDLGGAINKAQAALNRATVPANAQKYIVVISDGQPNYYNGSNSGNAVGLAIQSATTAKTAGTKIFAIGYFTNDDAEDTLRSISSNAVGDPVNYYYSASTSNITTTFETIFNNINTLPSGTNATLTDTLGSEFTYVSSNTAGVTHNSGVITYSIPTITEAGTTFSFNVKINNEANTGWHDTNNVTSNGVRLNYTNYDGESTQLAFTSSPQVYWVKPEYHYTVEYYNEGSATLLGTDTGYAHLNDVITRDDIDLDKYQGAGYIVKSVNPENLTISSNEVTNVITVTYGLINDLSYTVEYYYDNVIDNGKTYPVNNVTYGTLSTYTPKQIDGYKFASVTGNGISIIDNTTVVKVYYIKDSFAYRIEYYYDNAIDNGKTDSGTLPFNTPVNYTDKNINGYKFDHVNKTMPFHITSNPDNNVIKVYYVKDSFAYRVEYYYDGVKSDDDYTDSALFGTVISTYPDRILTGYTLAGTEGLNLTIGSNPNNNVIKVYYTTTRVTVTDESIDKTGTNEIISVDQVVDYTVTYNATIDDLVGSITLTITDKLPYDIDLSKSNLNSGVYNATDHTVTWTINYTNINTYNDDVKNINVMINYSVVYIGIDPTISVSELNSIANDVSASMTFVKNNQQSSTSPISDSHETDVAVQGTLVVNHIIEETNGLLDSTVTHDLVGTSYTTSQKSFDSYQYSKVVGNTTGTYIDGDIIVNYYYTKINATITTPTLNKTGTERVTDEIAPINYTVNYTTTVNNYIGNVRVRIIDYLPYALDESKVNEKAGGTYDSDTRTIIWIMEYNNINTYTNNALSIDVTKNLTLHFLGVSPTTRTIANNVEGTISLDATNQSDTKTDNFVTTLNVTGQVTARYLYGSVELRSDIITTGLVGETFSTNQLSFNSYEWQSTTGMQVGFYTKDPITVTYYYTKVNATIGTSTIDKTGTERSTDETSAFNYTVNYTTTVNNYLGDVRLTIVDQLPYVLDESKANDIADGTYNSANKTITWVIDYNDIDTYTTGALNINVTKNLTLYFLGISPTTREITNHVTGTVELSTTSQSDTKTDDFTTILNVPSQVTAKYLYGSVELRSDVITTGLVGESYTTDKLSFNSYEWVSTTGTPTGTYTKDPIVVIYYYDKVLATISTPDINKTGTLNITNEKALIGYRIKYEATIDNYVGSAELTFVDQLQYAIDESQANDLNGGFYDKLHKTITWTFYFSYIDTYEEGAFNVYLIKDFSLYFLDVLPTTRTIPNNVSGTIHLNATNQSDTKTDDFATALNVSGQVTAKYLYGSVELRSDVITTDLVGESYTTDKLNFNSYEWVSTTGIPTGTYTKDPIVVIYYYQKVMAGIESSLQKDGTEVLNDLNTNVDYEINYTAHINNYIGDIQLILIDTLPYAIDFDNSLLDGGIYNASNRTITWIISYNDVDTYCGNDQMTPATIDQCINSYLVSVTKNISLRFIGIDPTTRTMTNSINSDLNLISTEQSMKDRHDYTTAIEIYGKVIVKYFDKDGNEIATEDLVSGLVGNPYQADAIDIKGYKLVGLDPQSAPATGEFDVNDIIVSYIYEKVKDNIPQTGLFNNYGTYTMMSSISLLILIKFRKKFLKAN